MIKYELINKFASLTPDKAAIIYEGEYFSWEDFASVVLKIISKLIRILSENNDYPVFIFSENSSEVIFLSSALSSLEVPFQIMNYNLSPEYIEKLRENLQVKHFFISDKVFAKRQNVFNDININLHSIESLSNDGLCIDSTIKSDYTSKGNNKFKSYAFTSGTTGLPKIVYRTSSFDKRRFDFMTKKYDFSQKDLHLTCLPMYHASSTGWMRLFLNLGATIVVHNFYSGYDLCDVIYKNNITTTIMSPYMLRCLVESIEDDLSHKYFSALRFVMTGGKNCPIILKEKAIKILGAIIHEYYGTTETGVNTLLDSSEAIKYPGSVGKVFDGNDILILDENNIPVTSGRYGRIAISSYMNMDCYLNNETEFTIFQERKFIITMDYGILNKEGYLFIYTRGIKNKSRVINAYGIENEVLNLDFIADVNVTAVNNDESLEINIVAKKYMPSLFLKKSIGKVVERYGEIDFSINILPELKYTQTGKICLSLNQSS